MNEGGPTGGAPEPRAKKITCEFCQCSVTQDGEILKLSDKAKAYRDAGDENDKKIAVLEKEKRDLEGTIETLRAEIERLKTDPTPAPSKRKGFLVSR